MKDDVIDWLKDAYAMERGLEVTLKKLSENDEAQPVIRAAAAKHLRQTQEHAAIVKGLLESHGADVSSLKTGLGMMAETMKGLGTRMATDETVKDLLSGYATEHFEIICYHALIAAGNRAGMPDVVEACHRIIRDEEEMARAIFEALPSTVHDHLSERVGA